MRAAFWLVLIAGGLLVLVSWTLLDRPVVFSVVGEVIEAWYLSRTLWAAALGATVGAVMAVTAPRRVRYEPRKSGRSYLRRVVRRGFVAELIAVIGIGGVLAISGAFASFIPASALTRVVSLLWTGMFLSVIGGAALASGLAYAVVTRAMTWGGQFAVLSPSWTPAKGGT